MMRSCDGDHVTTMMMTIIRPLRWTQVLTARGCSHELVLRPLNRQGGWRIASPQEQESDSKNCRQSVIPLSDWGHPVRLLQVAASNVRFTRVALLWRLCLSVHLCWRK